MVCCAALISRGFVARHGFHERLLFPLQLVCAVVTPDASCVNWSVETDQRDVHQRPKPLLASHAVVVVRRNCLCF